MSPVLPDLPPEIWLEIFEWATYNPNVSVDDHVAFEPVPDGNHDSNFQVRVAIASVCSAWRRWIAESLYKDIEIRRDAHALQWLLEGRQHSGGCYGEMVCSSNHMYMMVQRMFLSSRAGSTRGSSISEHGDSVFLLRPQHHSVGDGLSFDREAEGITLPSVQRLEWWHHGEAERSGGINSLGFVLRNIPNLRYLFVGGVVGADRVCSEPTPIILTQLETLRLCIRSGLLFYRILFKWHMPMLRHIVMDAPPVKEGMEAIWDIFGDQIESVGFGRHIRFLMNDNLAPCLRGCPNLKELNYYILFTVPGAEAQFHANLEKVGLHAHVNPLLASGTHIWRMIALHFDILSGPNFPSLKKVVLYGDWRPILSHPLFHPIEEKLRDSGRTLQFARDARRI